MLTPSRSSALPSSRPERLSSSSRPVKPSVSSFYVESTRFSCRFLAPGRRLYRSARAFPREGRYHHRRRFVQSFSTSRDGKLIESSQETLTSPTLFDEPRSSKLKVFSSLVPESLVEKREPDTVLPSVSRFAAVELVVLSTDAVVAVPGGSPAAWPHLKDIFQKTAAQVEGQACCDWVGEGGSGHVCLVVSRLEYSS